MITKIEINGFKSFIDFKMEFSPLTVIAGTNASGKSNLFDALHLLSNTAKSGFLPRALSKKQLRGEVSELFTKYTNNSSAPKMEFAVEMLVPRKIHDIWNKEAEIETPRLRYELSISKRINEMGFEELYIENEALSSIVTDKDEWANKYLKNNKNLWECKTKNSKSYIKTLVKNGKTIISIQKEGSSRYFAQIIAMNRTILGSLNSPHIPHIFAARQEIASWNFMQLNPELLREPTNYDSNYPGDEIGHSGENLAATLYRLKRQDEYLLEQILIRLSSFLPDYTKLEVLDDKANKQFIFKLHNMEGKKFSSRVLSEGTLRLLVLCVLLYDDKFQGLLCFEEPENGIHPYRIKAMAELLRLLATDFTEEDNLLRQIIVNTHSPVLLRCLKDMYNDSDNGVSIWFSKLISYPLEIDGERHSVRISRITPLTKSMQTSFSDAENKMTIADAIEYLNTEKNI